MLSRWQGGFAALIVTLLTGVLTILDVLEQAQAVGGLMAHALGVTAVLDPETQAAVRGDESA